MPDKVTGAAVFTHGLPERVGDSETRVRELAAEAGVELGTLGEGAPDLVVALGGDGTMLRALRATLGTSIPVFGVNFGRMGFLTSAEGHHLEDALRRVFAGEYRMVELIGTPSVPAAADSATNRCSTTLYPFPASDRNPLTKPNNDGPLRYLTSDTSFQTAATIEFWPDGSAHMQSGTTNPWPVIASTGTSIVLLRKSKTKTITVNGLGKITLVP